MAVYSKHACQQKVAGIADFPMNIPRCNVAVCPVFFIFT